MRISTGVDIIEIERIKKLIDKYRNDPALNRIFCHEEINYCKSKGECESQSFAARFAAKEAVSKALGTGFSDKCELNEICIRNNSDGTPYIVLSGKAKKTFEEQNGMDLSLSVSHCKEYAVAMVVMMKGDSD